jgi:hypothetical protein
MTASNFRQAVVVQLRASFLTTPDPELAWHGDRHYVDGVAVTVGVYELAAEGRIAEARAAWLEEIGS